MDLAVYLNSDTPNTTDFDKVVATGFEKNDYVLVQISNPTVGKVKPVVESIELAPVVAGGEVDGRTVEKGTTAATITVGDETYNEANKFFLNRDENGVYNVITDTYGNAIGLAEGTTNYLVIEKIEWKHSPNAMGGYALADVVLADGSEVANVTIANIGDEAASNANDSYGDVAKGSVSDSYVNNGSYTTDTTFVDGYYNHIFTYSVNSDGSYNITTHDTDINDVAAGTGTITNGVATISSSTNTYVATNTTVFLLKNDDGYTYTAYVGKDNVPTITKATLCILTDESDYATLVVASNYDLDSNTFLAYVTDNDKDATNSKGDGYYVYKLGETTATMVYAKTAADWKYSSTEQTGLYEFTVNADNQITGMNAVLCDLHCTGQYEVPTEDLERAAVKAAVQDGSFQAQGYSAVTLDANNDNGYTVTAFGTVKDFNVTDATTYIVVTKNALTGSDATLAAGTAADVTAGSVVLVDYTVSGNKYTADIVYILKVTDDDVETPDLTYQVSGTPTIAGTKTGITLTGLTFTYEDSTATVNPGAGGTISVQLYKFAGNGYTWYKAESATMPGSTITGGTWTLNKTIATTLEAGQYYGNVTVTMADGTTQTFNQVTFTVA